MNKQQHLKRGSSLAILPSSGDVREPMIPQPRPTDESKPVKNTFFIPRRVHRRLKEICLAREISQQTMLTAALDMWLIAQGEPGIKELESGE
jgi:hypothetical protein